MKREVALAYSKLEIASHARNFVAFAPMVAEEFVAASSNSDRLQAKRSRMARRMRVSSRLRWCPPGRLHSGMPF
jgi:hypothetical protein